MNFLFLLSMVALMAVSPFVWVRLDDLLDRTSLLADTWERRWLLRQAATVVGVWLYFAALPFLVAPGLTAPFGWALIALAYAFTLTSLAYRARLVATRTATR